MAAQHPHGARLRTLIASHLDERDEAADFEVFEVAVEDATLLKIDLVPVFRGEVAVFVEGKQPHHVATRLPVGLAAGFTLSANVVLYLPLGDVERVVHGQHRVFPLGVCLGHLVEGVLFEVADGSDERRIVRHDEMVRRHREFNPHMEPAAGGVMAFGELDHDPTRRDRVAVLFKLFGPCPNVGFERGGRRDTAERDDRGECHSGLPIWGIRRV